MCIDITTPVCFFLGQINFNRCRPALGALLLASMLMAAGNAQADPVVGIAVENDLDSNGEITVVDGGTVRVAYTVIRDDDKDLDRKDKIELRRVADDSLVDSVERGKKKNGTVTLKVRKAAGDALYVQYLQKGKLGTVITRIHHPSDPGYTTLLTAIARENITDLTIGLNAIRKQTSPGVVSVAGVSFHDKNGCALDKTGFYLAYSAGTICDAFAPIQFPNGVTVTELNCMVLDPNAAPGAYMRLYLMRKDLMSGFSESMLITNISIDSGGTQVLTDTSAELALVDNSKYAYFLWVNFGPVITALRVYGCTASYE